MRPIAAGYLVAALISAALWGAAVATLFSLF